PYDYASADEPRRTGEDAESAPTEQLAAHSDPDAKAPEGEGAPEEQAVEEGAPEEGVATEGVATEEGTPTEEPEGGPTAGDGLAGLAPDERKRLADEEAMYARFNTEGSKGSPSWENQADGQTSDSEAAQPTERG